MSGWVLCTLLTTPRRHGAPSKCQEILRALVVPQGHVDNNKAHGWLLLQVPES
jgi:hypothetical protein